MLPVHEPGTFTGKATHFIAIQKDVTVLKGDGNPLKWTPTEVAIWLEKYGWNDQAMKSFANSIDGKTLLSIKLEQAKYIGFTDSSVQKLQRKLKVTFPLPVILGKIYKVICFFRYLLDNLN